MITIKVFCLQAGNTIPKPNTIISFIRDDLYFSNEIYYFPRKLFGKQLMLDIIKISCIINIPNFSKSFLKKQSKIKILLGTYEVEKEFIEELIYKRCYRPEDYLKILDEVEP